MDSGEHPAVNASVSQGRSICKGLIAVCIAEEFACVSMRAENWVQYVSRQLSVCTDRIASLTNIYVSSARAD
jgi:hypothetical protein